MREEIDSFSLRLQTLQQEFQERGKLSEANRLLLDQIRQHKDRVALKLSDAERLGNWGTVKNEIGGDWNSLYADFVTLEDRFEQSLVDD